MNNYKIDLAKAVSEEDSLEDVTLGVQKHAFKLGCTWSNEHPQEPRYLPSQYFFITEERLTHGLFPSTASFQEHPNELITVEDFLLIQPEHEGAKMTKQEAQIRMIKGERPFSGAYALYFDEPTNRFLCQIKGRATDDEIVGLWDGLDKWYWPMTFEQSGKYEICWVSDNNPEERVKLSVVRFDSETGGFRNKDNIPWEYATPVEAKECWRYKRCVE